MTPQMIVFYRKRYPGISITPYNEMSTKLVFHGEEVLSIEMTSIDEEILKQFDPLRPPLQFEHVSTSEQWESYKTVTSGIEIAVEYQNDAWHAIHIKGLPDSYTTTLTNQDDITELLSALHAAVAGIQKRLLTNHQKGSQNASTEPTS